MQMATISNAIRREVLEQLKEFKAAKQFQYDIQSLGIFGSVARGEARVDSDVDIVFETGSPNLFKASRMRQELEDALRRPVDLVRLRDNMNSRLKERISRDAVFV